MFDELKFENCHRRRIDNLFGLSVPVFAYPHGEFFPDIIGLSCVGTSVCGPWVLHCEYQINPCLFILNKGCPASWGSKKILVKNNFYIILYCDSDFKF